MVVTRSQLENLSKDKLIDKLLQVENNNKYMININDLTTF